MSEIFKMVVGKGDKTFFWKDTWCSNVPLKDLFPNLYVVELNKDCLLVDKVENPTEEDVRWLWSCSRQLRRGIESNQILDLLNLINNFKPTGGLDKWLWIGDGGADFSIKAIRLLINKGKEVSENSFNWVNWIPLKINCCM